MTTGEFLRMKLACSTGIIKHLKKNERGIVQNGRRVTVRSLLHTGDILELASEDEPENTKELIPVCAPLDIIYEDGDIIAVNKPDRMPTHPSRGHQDDTLANVLAAYFAQKGVPFVFRAVNRLDHNTTGVVVVAKNRLTASRLSAAIAAGEATKLYLAVTDGIPDPPEGCIVTDIRRKAESIITREALPAGSGTPGAQLAATEYRVLHTQDGRATLLLRPLTGRTHQLRVHLAHIGTPLLGDDLYGQPSGLFPHQALHAFGLTLSRDRRLRFLAPPPPSFAALADIHPDTLSSLFESIDTERQGFL